MTVHIHTSPRAVTGRVLGLSLIKHRGNMSVHKAVCVVCACCVFAELLCTCTCWVCLLFAWPSSLLCIYQVRSSNPRPGESRARTREEKTLFLLSWAVRAQIMHAAPNKPRLVAFAVQPRGW
jgi:hypothetical protein